MEKSAALPVKQGLRRGKGSGHPRWREGVMKQACLQIALGLGGLLILVPFLYVLSLSLQTDQQWMTHPNTWIPSPFTAGNYVEVFRSVNVLRMMTNTLLIVVGSTAGSALSCAVVAYPLARIRFPGRRIAFLAVISTLMLPPQILLIPQYLVFNKLGWVDTLLPLIVPTFFGLNAFYVFLFRQFFRSIPKDLDEAVFLDGGSHFTIFWRVILPLSKPALTTVAVLNIVGTYNDFFGPLVYLHSKEHFTMTIGMAMLASSKFPAPVPLLMADSILLIAPLMVFFFFAQKWLTRGIELSAGIKG